MCAGHVLRTLRWELFINVYEKPNRKRLIKSLSLGYLINYFVPYKIGDLVRGFYAGKKMKNGKALGLSTVIVDRYLDVLSVGFIFVILSLINSGNAQLIQASKFYIIFFFALIVATLLVYALRGVLKRIIRLAASVFNEQIEVKILRFIWALIWNFKDIFLKLNKLKIILYTIGMWATYIFSYGMLAVFFNLTGNASNWTDVFLMLFGSNGVKASTLMLTMFKEGIAVESVWFLLYMIIPLCLLFAGSVLLPEKGEKEKIKNTYLNLLPQLNEKERLTFLDKYFSNESKEYIENYLKINQGISIIRDYSAGSNATTMLCVDNRGSFFRKYAFGEDGKKLKEQIEWINENAGEIALPEILESNSSDFYCFYDMPYKSNAVGFFEYAHSMPVEESRKILLDVLSSLQKSFYSNKIGNATQEVIKEYIEKKVTRNIQRIKESKKLKQLCDYDEVIINGKTYPGFKYYEKYLTTEYLSKVFAKDEYSVIHGDLTIENIVCVKNRDGSDGFYLIDPNTGNIHNSPHLDYAKLLQSLHGGYEFLMSVKNVTVDENAMDFLYAKSFVYEDLYKSVDEYLSKHFDKDTIRSIYFHEVVHWLRLMPYKIEKDYHTAPAFFAGMLMVMDDVVKKYGEE